MEMDAEIRLNSNKVTKAVRGARDGAIGDIWVFIDMNGAVIGLEGAGTRGEGFRVTRKNLDRARRVLEKIARGAKEGLGVREADVRELTGLLDPSG